MLGEACGVNFRTACRDGASGGKASFLAFAFGGACGCEKLWRVIAM